MPTSASPSHLFQSIPYNSKSLTSSSKKDSNCFHVVPYSYPQGLPLKETQANLHLATNTFDNAKPKEPKPSCTIMPISASPSPSIPKSSTQSQHDYLS